MKNIPKFQFYFINIQDDPSQQGYSKVTQSPAEGTLSASTTSTSLDTVADRSNENISSSPPSSKPKTSFSPIIESEDNPVGGGGGFAHDIKELAKRAKKSNLKGGHISFGEDEAEEADKFDEDAFTKKREHFQKTKSRSEHKSLILRVSELCIVEL